MSIEVDFGPLRAVCDRELPAESAAGPRVQVLLHGRGTDGHDLVDLGTAFGFDGPTICFHAPTEWALGGRLWFDDADRDGDVRRSVTLLQQALAALEARLPGTRVHLGGFSQGGVMTLELGLREPGRFASLLCMSGWLLESSATRDALPEPGQVPSLLLTHGRADPLVPVERARATSTFLREHGLEHDLVEDDCGHALTQLHLRAIAGWLGG